MSEGETHYESNQPATAQATAEVPEPVTAPESDANTVVKEDDVEQKLGEHLAEAIIERDEKSPHELYRLGNLISPTISVDYLSLYAHTFPKPKMKDGEPHFSNPEEKEFAEDYSGAVMYYTPGAIGDRMLEREGSNWQNGFTKASSDKRVVPQSHAKSGTGASALLRRIRKTGAPITLWLPHTGIYVTFIAPTEADYCEYDIQQTMETAEVGRATHGLLMNMASGIYLKSQVEFALRYAISTTYDCEGGDIAQTLSTVIKQQDYGKVITGPTIAKFPSGLPWTFLCPNGGCKARHQKLLNLSRAMRDDNNALTDAQRKFMEENTRPETVTADMLKKYQAEFRETSSAKYTAEVDGGSVTFEFKMTELHDYFVKTNEWVKELSDTATEALAGRATAHERESYMRQRNEARRLTRYAHMVNAIVVSIDEDGELIEEREESKGGIVEMLADLTSDRELTNGFEAAIQQFIIDNTHTLIAYKAHKCESCGAKQEDAIDEGAFRGLVPISPDRIFFGLSQQVSMVTNLLSNRSD